MFKTSQDLVRPGMTSSGKLLADPAQKRGQIHIVSVDLAYLEGVVYDGAEERARSAREVSKELVARREEVRRDNIKFRDKLNSHLGCNVHCCII